MDKFSAFAQILENPFSALKFRQDPHARKSILAEHGFTAQETQAICDGVTADDENQLAKLFGHKEGQYLMIIIVIDAISASEKSAALAQ
jgi:hypothetical protein